MVRYQSSDISKGTASNVREGAVASQRVSVADDIRSGHRHELSLEGFIEMTDQADHNRFENIVFDDFRRMALDESLSPYERIGFPDSYRQGKEQAIFEDVRAKLHGLDQRGKIVLDIGPGCSELPLKLIDLCEEMDHTLILVDSAEMLSRLPDKRFIKKVAAYYPVCEELFKAYSGKIDVILTYSVMHYVFAESNVWDFLDQSLALLAQGGAMLIGDIPNVSKRKRFFSSPRGIAFHQQYTGTQERPEVTFNNIERSKIDDAVILSLMMRARQQGFSAYVLPQSDDLPMANRREDILIIKP